MKQLFVIVLVMSLIGCGRSTDDRAGDGPKGKEHSHSAVQAVEYGAPSIDKAWSPQDYVTFDAYLATLPSNSFPRVESSNSSALFMKAVDSVEQPLLAEPDIHLNDRMELGLQMQQAANNTLKRYYSAHNSGTDYSTEMVYLQGMALSITRQLLALVDEFIPTIDPHDEKYEVRMQGLQTMKNGMAIQLDGAFLSMKEISTYSSEERLILVKYVVAEAPAILNHLAPSVRREFEIKISRMHLSESDSNVKRMLADLSKTIKGQGYNKMSGGDVQ